MRFESALLFIHRHYKNIIIAVGTFTLIAVLLFGVSSKESEVSASTSDVKYFKCITIDNDDSLWNIAQEYMSEEYDSVEEYIDEVKQINNLKGDIIYSGATLVVPYYSTPG